MRPALAAAAWLAVLVLGVVLPPPPHEPWLLGGFAAGYLAAVVDRAWRHRTTTPGRHRRVPGHVVCACHGRDLTAMRDADVYALHPLPQLSGFVRWTPDGPPLDDDEPVRG